MKLEETNNLNYFRSLKDICVIHYSNWGGNIQDNKYWTAEMNGEVLDYHYKNHLIKSAISNNLSYIVLKNNKKTKDWTVVERGANATSK